jgi:SlyX protein
VNLETRLAFQEQAIDTLSRTLAAQGEVVAELRERVAELSRTLRQLAGSPVAAGSPHEPPPHY